LFSKTCISEEIPWYLDHSNHRNWDKKHNTLSQSKKLFRLWWNN
jgi:hypothetical protein